jgi:RNA-directed DNA polymerase
VVDADLKGYFDTIPQGPLMALVEEKISDSRLLELMWKMLKQGVMETAKGWTPTEQGTPQGAVISPLLANIYLNPLDQMMARQARRWCAMQTPSSFYARAKLRPKQYSDNCANGWRQRD